MPTLDPQHLQVGDVLLSRSAGDISDLICALDGSEYSHAALWDGSRVIAATPKGVRSRALGREAERRSVIDVYRFRFYDHPLGDPGWPAEPVTAQATAQIADDVTYHELYQAGLLLAVGRRPSRDTKRLALSLLADRIAEFTQAHVTQRKQIPIVPGEVVAASYWRAASLPEHKYGLSVRIDGDRAFAGIPSPVALPEDPEDPPKDLNDERTDADYERLAQDCGRLLLAARPELAHGVHALQNVHADAARRATQTGLVVVAGDALLPLACVTPRDLCRSPSLEKLGCLRP